MVYPVTKLLVITILALIALAMLQLKFSTLEKRAIPLEGTSATQTGFYIKNCVESRLIQAEANWRSGLEKRKLMLSQNLIDKQDPWGYKGGVSIWDYFYPSFDCPHTVERIGKPGDGGKWICGLNHVNEKAKDKCVVYSFGISNEITFEEEIMARTNCSVYMFDHTVDEDAVTLPKKYPNRAFFRKVGLGVKDSLIFTSLLSAMRSNGHMFIDILKIDVEGSEFQIFKNIQNDFPNGLPFGQLAIEVHVNFFFLRRSYDDYLNWFLHLEEMGLRPFNREFNLLAMKFAKLNFANLCEYSFINMRTDNYLLHS